MNVNIPYSDMTLPIQGPENPFGDRNQFLNQNALSQSCSYPCLNDILAQVLFFHSRHLFC